MDRTPPSLARSFVVVAGACVALSGAAARAAHPPRPPAPPAPAATAPSVSATTATTTTTATATTTTATTGCAPTATERVRVVVLDLNAAAFSGDGNALSAVVAAEAARVPGLAVLTTSDLKAAVAHEADRQLVGCDDDTGCLAELADAVDADLLVHGSLSTTLTDAGDSAPVVSLTLLNARALVVVNRVTFAWRGAAAALPDVVASATQHLLVPASARPPGRLQLVGLPVGARVLVDAVDRTDAVQDGVLAPVAAGPHELQVTFPGKRPSVHHVVVKGAAALAVPVVLEEAPVPDAVVWGGAAAAAVLGVGATLGVVWATTRGGATVTATVPVWGVGDVEALRGTQ
jgi:hypothetical protein